MKHLSPSVSVVLTTGAAKKVLSRLGKNENNCEMKKIKNGRAKGAKLLFFIVNMQICDVLVAVVVVVGEAP